MKGFNRREKSNLKIRCDVQGMTSMNYRHVRESLSRNKKIAIKYFEVSLI